MRVCNTNHLEALGLMICRQEHVCPQRCGSSGICEIATTPQKIESVFVGKRNTQYTKVPINNHLLKIAKLTVSCSMRKKRGGCLALCQSIQCS
jgi:hypothetical protein